MPPQPRSYRLQKRESIVSKPSEKEHASASDRVEHLPEVCAIQEQIDKLGYVEIVNQDGRLVLRSDYQSVLFGLLVGLDIPNRCSVHSTSIEARPSQLSLTRMDASRLL